MKTYFLFEFHNEYGWDYLGEMYREIQGDDLQEYGINRSSWTEDEAREKCTYYCVVVERIDAAISRATEGK